MLHSTERFTSRVDDYVRFRPSYPAGVIATLQKVCGLGPGAKVADVGAGTGIFSRLLLDAGAEVYAVEPNEAMRTAAEEQLSAFHGYHSLNGTAEQTLLEDRSVDLVTAAQAFHWFHPTAARAEFQRILRPQRFVALVWNERLSDVDRFSQQYETLLREYADEYLKVRHRNVSEGAITDFFDPNTYRLHSFDNTQRFDWEGLLGRVMSSSYAPQQGHARHQEFVDALKNIYDSSQIEGEVEFRYETRLYLGVL